MISTEEMIKAVQEFSRHLLPITEADISLVENNESLSVVQKFKIRRKLKRIINEQNNNP